MAKVSDIAKERIMNELSEVYPAGKVIDKKFYVNFSIEGEDTQICISLTAPKNAVPLDGVENAEVAQSAAAPAFEEEKIKKEAEAIFDFFKLGV